MPTTKPLTVSEEPTDKSATSSIKRSSSNRGSVVKKPKTELGSSTKSSAKDEQKQSGMASPAKKSVARDGQFVSSKPANVPNQSSKIKVDAVADNQSKSGPKINQADLQKQREAEALKDAAEVHGVLDLMNEGYGFLRQSGLTANVGDVYVSTSQIRRFDLRVGDDVVGLARRPKDNEKYFGLLRVDTINGRKLEDIGQRPRFERLVPIYPDNRFKLETSKDVLTTRLLDLVSPVGRGQRGLIVAQPKAGKTYLLKDIANGITSNYKDVKLMVVLIGERPEEVTDIARSVSGDVYASNFDEPSENQVKVAELALEKAKREVELGSDIVILLDSITRLARAYNLAIPPSGRTLSGGFDPAALYPPKKFFGAARNVEHGGSLTIIATALIDTGSRMDDLIYEEFKGTGNMELHLDRKLAERRIYPSIDVTRSGTRHEELMFNSDELKAVWRMRRMIETLGQGQESTELLLDRLRKTDTNNDFLATLHQPM